MARHKSSKGSIGVANLMAFAAFLAAGMATIAIPHVFVLGTPAPRLAKSGAVVGGLQATAASTSQPKVTATLQALSKPSVPLSTCLLGAALLCAAVARRPKASLSTRRSQQSFVALRAMTGELHMSCPSSTMTAAAKLPERLPDLLIAAAAPREFAPKALPSHAPLLSSASLDLTATSSIFVSAVSVQPLSSRPASARKTPRAERSKQRHQRRGVGSRLLLRALRPPSSPMAFDPSKVRTKIQMNLQIGRSTSSLHGHQGKFLPSSRGPAHLGDAGLHSFTTNSMDVVMRICILHRR